MNNLAQTSVYGGLSVYGGCSSLIYRSLMAANKDQSTLVQQHFASGMCTEEIEKLLEEHCPFGRNLIKPFDPLQLKGVGWHAGR